MLLLEHSARYRNNSLSSFSFVPPLCRNLMPHLTLRFACPHFSPRLRDIHHVREVSQNLTHLEGVP
jgi:hypothetical protein